MPVAHIFGHIEERWSRAAWWSRRFAVFAIFVAAIAIAAHRFDLIETIPFFWVLALVAGLAVCALLLAAAGFQRVWHLGDRGGADVTVGSTLALLLLAPYAVVGWWAFSYPPLVDISTDLDDPPRFAAAAAFRTKDMNPISAPTAESRVQQTKAYPELTGRRYAVSFEQMASEVETLMRARDWRILSSLPASGAMEANIEAVADLPVLALDNDVAVRITDEGNAIYVDMRSASRYGSRDMGLNAARIDEFLKELDARADALAAPSPPAVQPGR